MARIKRRRRAVLRLLSWWVPFAAMTMAAFYLLHRAAGPHPGFWVTCAVGAGGYLLADWSYRAVRAVRRKILAPPVMRISWPADVPMPDAGPDILFMIEHGKTIQAIKCYREQNPGISLKEAKDVVDGIVERSRLEVGAAGPDPAGKP
jgi:hypothetical protein